MNHRTLAILASSNLVFGRESTAEATLRSIPPAHGPLFLIRFDDCSWPAGITVPTNSYYADDILDPKVIRRRFQAYLQSLRGREGWQHVPKIRKTGKRPAARRSARSREQRTRR